MQNVFKSKKKKQKNPTLTLQGTHSINESAQITSWNWLHGVLLAGGDTSALVTPACFLVSI